MTTIFTLARNDLRYGLKTAIEMLAFNYDLTPEQTLAQVLDKAVLLNKKNMERSWE